MPSDLKLSTIEKISYSHELNIELFTKDKMHLIEKLSLIHVVVLPQI